MAAPELLNYIRPLLQGGVSKEQIRATLLQAGWQSGDVEAAFGELSNEVSVSETNRPVAQKGLFQRLPYVTLGLGGLLMYVVVCYFAQGMIASAVVVVFSLIGIFLFAGVAKLLKVPGPLLGKTVFLSGMGAVVSTVFLLLIRYAPMDGGALQAVLVAVSLLSLIFSFVLTKYVYGIGWLKTIGLIVLSLVLSMLLGAIVVVILFFLFGAMIFGMFGAFTGGSGSVSLDSTQTQGIQYSLDEVKTNDTSPITTDRLTKETVEVWKTIELGTYQTSDSLQEAIVARGYQLSLFAGDIFSDRVIPLEVPGGKATLVKVSLRDLLGKDEATRGEIEHAGELIGLQRCPAEVGPQLLLQTIQDEADYDVEVVMEPLIPVSEAVGDNGFDTFGVSWTKHFGGPTLEAGIGSPTSLVIGNREFIFCLP